MDLNEKNGQPSMEEILASIRRIIAEEPNSNNPVIDLHAKQKARVLDADDGNDFELPSIFRPNTTPPAGRQPLFGRLTDAIRSASSAMDRSGHETSEPVERYRGSLRDSSGSLPTTTASPSDPGRSPAENHSNGPYNGTLRGGPNGGTLSTALSSLKLTRGEAPMQASNEAAPSPPPAPTGPSVVVAPVVVASERVAPILEPIAPALAPAPVTASAALPPAALNEPIQDVRRVMVPFKDMRMSRMSTPESAPEPALSAPSLDALFAPDTPTPAVEVAPVYAASVEPSVGPTSNPNYPHSPATSQGFSLDDMHRFAPVMEPPRPVAPPPVAVSAPVHAPSPAGGIEDATADLLRPMLRQWLSENMPRMVEKALSIELAQSVNRKFNGQ